MSSSDCDSTSLLLGSLVDHVVIHDLTVSRCFSENLGNGSGKSGLSVTICNSRKLAILAKLERSASGLLDVTDGTVGVDSGISFLETG